MHISFYQFDKIIMSKEWYNDLIEIPFEHTTILCPIDYESALSHQYGDWRKMVKGGSLHEGCYFDPDKSYTFYKDKDIINMPSLI